MSWRRLVAAGVLLVLAVFAVLLASDLRNWRTAVTTGDTRFAQGPATARWRTSALLPGDPALHILSLPDQLAFRRAMKRFGPVVAAGNGIDNGYTESAARGDLEGDLTDLAHSSDPRQAAEADNLLGILAFIDSQSRGGASAPAPVERSEADFAAAVAADPTYEDAKFNLELLMRRLLAKGVRPGSNSSSGGPAKGHHGAAGGVPGRGY